MEPGKITENIYQFTFINEKSEFPINITALIDGTRIILIDTGYERFAEQVKEYFIQKGISDFLIFLSHHHEDHFDGCKSFTESPKYAARIFKEDFQQHLQDDKYMKDFTPDEYLIDGESFKTENFRIKYIYTPGHNKCEYSFLINNKYLYAGDLIFYNKDGVPSIPYLDANSLVDEYIKSLKIIKSLDPEYLLLGHGHYLDDKQVINNQIENRLLYLRKIQSAVSEIPLDECLRGSKFEYCGLNFHAGNLKSASKS